METLQSLFPNADDLLAMKPEELAPILLKLAAARRQQAGFWPDTVTQVTTGTGMATTAVGGYPMACSTNQYLASPDNFVPAVRLALRNCY